MTVVEAVMPRIQDTVAERTRLNNPNIDLSTAENCLIRKELIEMYQESIQRGDLATHHLSYPLGFSGDPDLLTTLSTFLNDYFDPHEPVKQSHLATAPGAASCLDALLHTLCDPGDGVLVPGPYWNGFDFQFRVRASVTPLVVNCPSLDETFSSNLLPALEDAVRKATIPVKALVFTNPHNPLAQCYPRKVLQDCLRFCEQQNLHFISDEVYAMSTIEPGMNRQGLSPFVSILSCDPASTACSPSRVHAIWSISKDFGSSGVRLGCTVSQHNPKVIIGVSLASNTQVSSLATIFTRSILGSSRTQELVALNRLRLSAAYYTITEWLRVNGFSYIPVSAGVFVFAKLGHDIATWDEEAQLVKRCKEAGVIVSADSSHFTILQRSSHYPMDSTLETLNGHLASVLDLLRGGLNKELHSRLHNQEKGVLPDKGLAELSFKTIDLLHSIEQLLEPSQLALADHFFGYMNTKCLCAAVELQVPDILRDNGPLSVEELASKSGARSDRLEQVLNVLQNNGIFTCYDGKYSNNHTSTLLLRDHWMQWHNWIALYGNQFYDMSRGIPSSIRKESTRNPAQIAYDTDKDMFTYFRDRDWVVQLHRTLGGGATAQAPGIVADYQWEEVSRETVLDVGGGGGALIALLLRAHPTMRGGIYDLPHVIDHTVPFFHTVGGQYADLSDRVPKENLIGGDFFDHIPPSRVYTMKWTLHDWRDTEAIAILRNIRQAIILAPVSRLIVLECVRNDGQSARLTRYADLNMMVAANGLERNADSWKHLAAQSGWRIEGIHQLRNAWPCAIDMRPC
ncbi:1-aminocyclopropane-1-carboxylate synthase 6 [Penicillium rolfsii]|nr:1-aminocyclopropane-1-carboxylate synthase 6 [Penicillium rolfsii]